MSSPPDSRRSGGDDAEPGTKVEPLKAPDANSVDWEDGDEAVRPEQVSALLAQNHLAESSKHGKLSQGLAIFQNC